MTSIAWLSAGLVVCVLICGPAPRAAAAPIPQTAPTGPAGINLTPLRHVIIIVQENRSFDSYFGAFPGAIGPPAGACVPLDPATLQNGCVAPFHDPHDVNAGGGHTAADAQFDAEPARTSGTR